MNNWIKFDKDKPETWIRGKQLLVLTRGEGLWQGQFEKGSESDRLFTNVGRGHCIFAQGITHYCVWIPPTEQPDTVSVPRVLECPDAGWFDVALHDYVLDQISPRGFWEEIITYFEAKEQSK